MWFFFSHVYSPRQGQTTDCGQKFYDSRRAFSLCPYIASFKMISSKSDFIHIFNDFMHVCSPGARAENPLGTNFWCQQKALTTSTKSLWILILYAFFNVFHMHIAPGQGQTTLCGQKSNVNRKALSLYPSVASLKNIFWSLILYICLPVFIHVYSPRAGADKPLGSEFLF